jgi:hypothetical protein
VFWEHLGPDDILTQPEAEFENLFRIPRTLFDSILERAAVSGLWTVNSGEPVAKLPGAKTHHLATPLALRIACCFRRLATGDSWKSLVTASRLCKSAMRDFFPGFIKWFVETFYSDWVTGASGVGFQHEDDVIESERMFRQMGLPGIVSSMDGVHCAWERAPYSKKWQFVGKEGFATVGWNVHILANGKIIYIAPPQPGGTNDKTFLRHDQLIRSMRTNPMFTDRRWRVHCVNVNELQGCASLCDNGYHQWTVCMSGYKNPGLPGENAWACRMESVRKNVERVFGQLKVRFGVLKRPFYESGKCAVDRIHMIFQTCAILHNMLQHEHSLDTIGLNAADWMELGPDLQRARARLRLKMQWRKHDGPGIGHQQDHSNYCSVEGVVPDEIEHDFRLRRALMTEHFAMVSMPGFDHITFPHDTPMWLRPASECRPRNTYVAAPEDGHAADGGAQGEQSQDSEDAAEMDNSDTESDDDDEDCM